MWLFTTFGFFSAVQKPGDDFLTIRGRSAKDLERLREGYLPKLGPTIMGGGTDYPCRARASHEDLAGAIGAIVRDVTYSNFKGAVGNEMGSRRSRTYHDVWSALLAIEREDQ
jgi:hypothetical protein